MFAGRAEAIAGLKFWSVIRSVDAKKVKPNKLFINLLGFTESDPARILIAFMNFTYNYSALQ